MSVSVCVCVLLVGLKLYLAWSVSKSGTEVNLYHLVKRNVYRETSVLRILVTSSLSLLSLSATRRNVVNVTA